MTKRAIINTFFKFKINFIFRRTCSREWLGFLNLVRIPHNETVTDKLMFHYKIIQQRRLVASECFKTVSTKVPSKDSVLHSNFLAFGGCWVLQKKVYYALKAVSWLSNRTSCCLWKFQLTKRSVYFGRPKWSEHWKINIMSILLVVCSQL